MIVLDFALEMNSMQRRFNKNIRFSIIQSPLNRV